MVYVVDTHALVWFLEGNSRLGEVARSIMADPESQLVLPALVLAEAAHLYARKRTPVSVDQILQEIAGAENCTVYPLDEQVATLVSGQLDIHDAIIVATALVFQNALGESATIITRDQAITAAQIVPTVW